ncbi:MAG: NAD(P)H-dependent oxidoreductase [Planctomycetes bacterium]|nr:NAD(P)H-dependent oxidoreductase [Planctomycetota bacterium]
MSQPISPAVLRERLQWRYATKQFDSKQQIPADVWQALEDALVLAPSSFGLQPWQFLVVDDKALRAQLRPVSWNQPQITDASKLVVFLGLRTTAVGDVDRLLARIGKVRGATTQSLDSYRQMMISFVQGRPAPELGAWNARQVYIALGQFMASAALLGVDTCPMEGFDPAAYDRILGLEGSPYRTLCVCAAGYRAAEDKYALAPKVRFAKDEVVVHR